MIKWTRSTGPEVILDGPVSDVDVSGDGTTIVTTRGLPGGLYRAIKIMNGDVQVLPVFSATEPSRAYIISQDGSTIVGYVGPWDEVHGWNWVRWIDDEISHLSLPAGSMPLDVSANGDVIVGASFRWTETMGIWGHS